MRSGEKFMNKNSSFDAGLILKIFGFVMFVYLFLGFMVLPCLNTLTSIFTTKDASGVLFSRNDAAFRLELAEISCRSRYNS